jgi:hypothetical protein
MNLLNTIFGREVDPSPNFGSWAIGGGEESVSEPLAWHSGEAYPQTESTVGGRQVEDHDDSFGGWELE